MFNNWTLTDLIPTTGLLAWHLYDPDTSTHGFIEDAAGTGRDLEQDTDPPVLTANVRNGRHGWYFDGATTNPLATSSSANLHTKTVFIYASHEDTAFSSADGLLSGKTSGDWFTSETSGTQFFHFGDPGYAYRKSDTAYSDASMEAPMGGVPELLEGTYENPGAVTIDGIQIGQQKATAANKWKGYFHEGLYYDRLLTQTERLRVMLYFNIKFGAFAEGVALVFPNKDLLTDASAVIAYSRFDDEEPKYEEITDSWKYDDGREDFNEHASTAPREWDVQFKVVGSPGDMPEAYAKREIFEAFYNAARRINAFYFTDKFGQTWHPVRIVDYKSSHQDHKSWVHNIVFKLRGGTDTVITSDLFGEGYLIDGSDYLVEG